MPSRPSERRPRWGYFVLTALSLLALLCLWVPPSHKVSPLKVATYLSLALPDVRQLQSGSDDPWQALVADPSLLPDFSKTLLVVNFNMGAQYYGVIPHLVELYQPFFPNMAFYGADTQMAGSGMYGVEGVEQRVPKAGEYGAASYRSFLAAYRAHPDYEGYLFTNDDVALNPFALGNLSRTLLWSKGIQADGLIYSSPERACEEAKSAGWRFGEPAMCQACSNAVERLPLTAQRRIGRKLLVGQADAYYVPKRLMREMTAMLEIFSEEGCWLEVAVSTASAAFDAADRFDLQNSSRWLWGDSRNRPSDFMQEDVALVHPIKIAAMGAAQAKEMIKQWLFKSETYWAVKSY